MLLYLFKPKFLSVSRFNVYYLHLQLSGRMENLELSFTFDEANFENDFAGDTYDFGILWDEFGAEAQQREEEMDLEQRFLKQLRISDTFNE